MKSANPLISPADLRIATNPYCETRNAIDFDGDGNDDADDGNDDVHGNQDARRSEL